MNPKILIFSNTYTLTDYVLTQWVNLAETAIEERGEFNVALSGGTTPLELFSKLAGLDHFHIWQHTHLFQVDERFVPRTHADNNWSSIQSNLNDYIQLPESQIHPMPTTEEQNVFLAAEAYEQSLKTHFGADKAYPEFDLVLLGIGEDGHTASLFPNDVGLTMDQKWVVGVTPEKVNHARISLSMPVLNSAHNVIIMVAGHNKADILERILVKKEDFPATRVNPVHGQCTYYLEKQAAGRIPFNNIHIEEDQSISIEV